MLARDVMTRDPAVVTPNDTIARAAEIMRERNVGLVPVVNDPAGMRLEGVITDRDITVRCVAERHHRDCRVADHMTSDHIDTARPDTPVDDVLDAMEHDRVRRVPVVDEHNRVVGIVAQADLALRLGPREPRKIEMLLEHISEPNEPASAPAARQG
jgi:CBS domain-containing protein